MKVTKKNIPQYTLRGNGTWGVIAIDCVGESVRVMINSDYGDWAYFWSHCGYEPRKFLRNMNMEYAMGKFMGRDLYVKDEEAREVQLKKLVIELRTEGYISKDDARDCWNYFLPNDEDDLATTVYESDYFDLLCSCDPDMLPSATKVDPLAENFWNDIWKPFIAELENELYPEEKV